MSVDSIGDRTALLPLIRPRIDFELIKLTQEFELAGDLSVPNVVYKVIASELAVTLVVDRDSDWQALTPSDLTGLGLDLQSALGEAKKNIVRAHPTLKSDHLFTRHDDETWSCLESDELESSLIFLFPDRVQSLSVRGKPLVFAPNANTVWIADSANTRSVSVLANATLDAYENSDDSALAPIPFILNNGRWMPYRVQLHHAAYRPIQSAWLVHQQQIYQAQRELIEKADREDRPLGAEFAIGPPKEHASSVSSYSFACLIEGMPTSLPKTDFVVLQSSSNVSSDDARTNTSETGERITVRWSDLAKICGAGLMPHFEYPQRYLSSTFPDAEQWAKLRAAEVDPLKEFASKAASPPPEQEHILAEAASNHSSQASHGNVIDQAFASMPSANPIETYHSAPEPKPAPFVQDQDAAPNRTVFWILAFSLGAIFIGLLLIGVTFGIFWLLIDDNKTNEVSRNTPRLNSDSPNRILPSRLPPNSAIDRSSRDEPETFRPPDPPDLDQSDVSLPPIAIDPNVVFIKGAEDFFTGRQTFTSQSPEGGVLVGLDVGIGNEWGGSVNGFRPIFQVGNEYKCGKWCGAGNLTDTFTLLPEPGYVVSAIHYHKGLAISSIQVEYARVGEDGLPDVTDRYASPRVGGEGGGLQTISVRKGFVFELLGTYDEQLVSIGWKAIVPLAECTTAIGQFDSISHTAKPIVGDEHGEVYLDHAPDGGVLVGFRTTCGDSWGGVIASLQPIYQVDDQYVMGSVLGKPADKIEDVIAAPGYVVGGLNIREGLVVDAIQLIYYRYDNGSLDETDDRRSEWIGINGGSLNSIESTGNPIVGVQLWGESDVEGITLFESD